MTPGRSGHLHDEPSELSCPRDCQGRPAFTLVELLIVLVMITILVSALAVSFSGRQDRQALFVAARDLAAAMRYAAEQATLRRVAHRLAFYDSFTSYRVEILAADKTQGFMPIVGLAGRPKKMPEAVRVSGVTVDGRELSELPETLMFDPAGETFCGTVQLTNRKGQTLTLETSDGAAQVRILGKPL